MFGDALLRELILTYALALVLIVALARLRIPPVVALIATGAIAGPAGIRIVRTQEDVQLLVDVSNNMMGNTVCVLADAAAMPTISFVNKFKNEFTEHVKLGRCPLRGANEPMRAVAHGH